MLTIIKLRDKKDKNSGERGEGKGREGGILLRISSSLIQFMQ